MVSGISGGVLCILPVNEFLSYLKKGVGLN